ncbi:MAG: MBL fold metallo-hydrolase [Deferribacteraceae bacterium]|jgi:phosphoribosyl 1,2-cyclic phosphodiesterase|nr:MBL fold metallo-hydrolase [Deferribacteraceae bacterium]
MQNIYNLHVLASGSSGNSYCIETDSDLVFVDIGVSLQELNAFFETVPHGGRAISLLITHEHGDHISGLPAFVRRFSPTIYSSTGTARAIFEKVNTEIITLQRDSYYDADSFAIVPFDVSHDAAEPFGFMLMTAQGNIGFATDLGCVTDKQLRHLEDSDVLVLEANHDKELLRKGKYPYYLKRRIASHKGHLSNDDAMAAIASLHMGNLKHCLLAHVSEENNSYELLEQCRAFCESAYGLQADVLRQKQSRSFAMEQLCNLALAK